LSYTDPVYLPFMLHRVVWQAEDKFLAVEYRSRDVAQMWITSEGLTNARIVEIHEDRPPYKGPFEVDPPMTRYERLSEDS